MSGLRCEMSWQELRERLVTLGLAVSEVRHDAVRLVGGQAREEQGGIALFTGVNFLVMVEPDGWLRVTHSHLSRRHDDPGFRCATLTEALAFLRGVYSLVPAFDASQSLLAQRKTV